MTASIGNEPRVLDSAQRHQLATIRDSDQFDANWYILRYPDVASLGLEPAFHYVWLGAELGRDPSADFSTRFYLGQNPDVAAARVNPLFHYVTSGREQGRLPLPPAHYHGTAKVFEVNVQFRVDRTAPIGTKDDWLLFVAYSPDGRLSDCQRFQIGSFKRAGYRIALVINSDDFGNLVCPGFAEADIQIVRENVGFDFGAWRHAIELIGGLNRARSVTFTNDSVLPVTTESKLKALRGKLFADSASVVFLTENHEVRPHLQSYFFRLSDAALTRGALQLVQSIPYYFDKDSLIHQVEIYLDQRFREAGHTVAVRFPLPGVENNPTIHHWERLLGLGFPFIKVQLITAGILDIADPGLKARLGEDVHRWLSEHCERRNGTKHPVASRNVPLRRSINQPGRFNEHGAQQAYNLPAQQNPTIRLPLENLASVAVEVPRILAVIHGFYVEIAAEILAQLAALEIPLVILVTTDESAKADLINAEMRRLDLNGSVTICPNRGRDVAPFVIEGAKFAKDADVILHLHTKKSPHDAAYADWGAFLRRNLVGSREAVLSILEIFARTEVGFIYSDHFSEVVGLRNWGFDFTHANTLLRSMGIDLNADSVLEFPTSTMFWAKRDALQPLFDAGLSYDDFEEEAGQIDGTLAHAIERCLLFITESTGAAFVKVTTEDFASELDGSLQRLSTSDLKYAFSRPTRYLAGESTVTSDFHSAVPEIYPVSVGRSSRRRRRLNAILPTMKPEKIYGGITTALRVLNQLIEQLPDDVDVRVLITSDSVDAESVKELSSRLCRSFTWVMPDDDSPGDTIVGVAENQHVPISLRSGEFYVATAWWTADLGYRLLDRQKELHGHSARLAYIIQDYEPGFYNWSNTFALADATYRRPDETAAIINSEELSAFLLRKHDFAMACCIPYEPHPRLAELIKPARPERVILAYGRPSVSRNCFELLCEGLRLWQARQPAESRAFQIVFAGEDFASDLMQGLINARNAGKMSLEDYAAALNQAGIGISLMVSPHPSYPPLEMAAAGCVTITNGYDEKDLSRRADNIISLDSLSPRNLATAIERAISSVNFDEIKQRRSIKAIKTKVPAADYASIARWLTPGD